MCGYCMFSPCVACFSGYSGFPRRSKNMHVYIDRRHLNCPGLLNRVCVSSNGLVSVQGIIPAISPMSAGDRHQQTPTIPLRCEAKLVVSASLYSVSCSLNPHH